MVADTTASRLARIEEKLDALAGKVDEYTNRTDRRINGISTRLDEVGLAHARSEHLEHEVETLKGQFRVWNGLNSVSAAFAAVLALFKH